MPHGIDTNVLLRLLVDDGSRQCKIVQQGFSEFRFFVTSAVLMEAEWVLRSSLNLRPKQISSLFKTFAGYPNVSFDKPEAIIWAIEALEIGFDFADALHIREAQDCEAFLTFDKRLIKKSAKLAGFVPVVSPLKFTSRTTG